MTTVALHHAALRDAGGAEPVMPRASRGLGRRATVMPWARAVATAELAQALALDFAHVPEPTAPVEFQAECVGVRDEAAGIRTVFLRRTDGFALGHRPGQYVRLALPVAGPGAEPLERCYSISTTPVRAGEQASPTPDGVFAVTVKRQAWGLGSNWIHDALAPGMALEAHGPLGGFHLPDFDRRARYLMLAAGAGITPIMSMVRTLATLPGAVNAVVVYHCSTPADFAFGHELADLSSHHPGLHVFLSLGDRAESGAHGPDVAVATGSEATGGPAWTGLRGRIRREVLDAIVADACGRQVYACGPSGYLEAVRTAAAEAGVSRNSYFEESFDVADHGEDRVPPRWHKRAFVEPGGPGPAHMDSLRIGPSAPVRTRSVPAGAQPAAQSRAGSRPTVGWDAAAASELGGLPDRSGASEAIADNERFAGTGAALVPGRPTVTFRRTGVAVSVGEGESLLDAGRRAGVPLKSNCRTGACGTCKVALLAGRVDMENGGGIRQREIDTGKILLCSSKPEGDADVDVDA